VCTYVDPREFLVYFFLLVTRVGPVLTALAPHFLTPWSGALSNAWANSLYWIVEVGLLNQGYVST
jgi:hypothetical protein